MSKAGDDRNSSDSDAGTADAGPKKSENDGLKAALKDERTKRQGLEQTVAGLQGQVEGLTAASASAGKDTVTPQKELSAADLRAAVEAGQLTDDQAQEIRDRQAERRTDRRVDERVTATVAQNSMVERNGAEIARYMAAVPELSDRSSAAFTKLSAEYNWLTDHGHAKGASTELVAARAAFGPIADVEATAKPGKRETHQETGGHGSDSSDAGEGKDKGAGPPKDMSAGHRRYYQNRIDSGAMPDWAAAKAEWSYKPQHAPRHRQAA